MVYAPFWGDYITHRVRKTIFLEPNVDDKHQIIVGAEAFGQGPENNLLKPMIETVKKTQGVACVKKAALTVDSGFHCKEPVAYCFEENVDAYIADGNVMKLDPRFIERDRYQPKERNGKYVKASDFSYDVTTGSGQCPAGYEMWSSGTCNTMVTLAGSSRGIWLTVGNAR